MLRSTVKKTAASVALTTLMNTIVRRIKRPNTIIMIVIITIKI